MGIVDFFRPKHRHSDPKVRLAAVRAMSSDDSLLPTIARTDKDAGVRRVAIEKIEDVDVLADVFDRESERDLRDLAGSRAAELWVTSACQDEDEELARNAMSGLIKVGDQKALAEVANRAAVQELRLRALAELREPRALAEVARTTTSPELRGKALARIDDQATLRALATDATVKELGIAVVDRMTSTEMLETVAQKAKNKAVRQRARRKVDEQQAAVKTAAPKVSDELLRRRAEKAQVLRSVEALAEHVEWVQSLETVKKAEREWERLGDTGEPAIDERFRRAVTHYYNHRDAAQRSIHERESEIVAGAQARREAEERAASERAERTARRARERDDEDDGDIVNQAAMALMKPAPLTDEQRAAREAEFAKRREAQDKRRAEDQLRRAEEQAAREARTKEQAERGASIARSMRALIDEMVALADSTDGKAIDRLLGQAATAFGQLVKAPATDRDELETRYREARGKLVVKLQEAREGEDWKRWSNVPRAENLVAAVKELAEREEQPTLDILKELQRLWKELGPLPQKKSQELWEQFKAHADAAFARIRAVRDVDRAKMDEHAQAREALIAEAEGLAESTDWEATAAAMKELQAKWKATGPVPRKQGDELWKRFRAACDKFFERRKPLLDAQHAELDVNLAAKRRLIERAEAVTAKAPSDRGWGADIGAIKDLQHEWKEIGHVPRAEVEKLWQQFRAACDGLFAKRDASRDAEGNARRAELEAMKAELEEVTAAAAAADGEAVGRALATRKKFLELRARESELGAELNELFEELLKTVVVIHGAALKGSDLDPTAMASKRSKLIGRASDLVPDDAPALQAGASIAEQLKAAMSQNALFKGDGRNPLEVLEELEAEWRAVGPVIGRDAERQAERFAEVCTQVRSRFGHDGSERRGDGERRGERRARPERRRTEGEGAAPSAVPDTIVSEAVTTPVLPAVEHRPATTPPPVAKPATTPPPTAEAKPPVARPATTPPPAAEAKPPAAKPATTPPPAALKPATIPPPPAKPATTPPPAAVKPATIPPPAAEAKTPSPTPTPTAEAKPVVAKPATTPPPAAEAKPPAAKPATTPPPAAEAKPPVAKPATTPPPAAEAKPPVAKPATTPPPAAEAKPPAAKPATTPPPVATAPLAPATPSASGAIAVTADAVDDDWGNLDEVPDAPASAAVSAAAEALVSAAAKKTSGAPTLPAAKPVAATPTTTPPAPAEEPAPAPAATDDAALDEGWE